MESFELGHMEQFFSAVVLTLPRLFTSKLKLRVSFFSVTAMVSSSTRENESSRLRPLGLARR